MSEADEITDVGKAFENQQFMTTLNSDSAKISNLASAWVVDANGKFVLMSTITALQSGFIEAATLSIILSFVTILLTTANLLLTVYAITSVDNCTVNAELHGVVWAEAGRP